MASDLAFAVQSFLEKDGPHASIRRALRRSTSTSDSEAFLEAAKDMLNGCRHEGECPASGACSACSAAYRARIETLRREFTKIDFSK